jgi:hypothetical protein
MTQQHAAVSYLNTSGTGGRTVIGCSCSWKPKKGAARMSMMHVSHMAHRRQLGLPRFDYSQTTYPAGTLAEGMTWDQFYAAHPGRDPFEPTSPTTCAGFIVPEETA